MREISSGSSSPSTPRGPAELGWGCRSAGRSSRATGASCGQVPMSPGALYFSSPCPSRSSAGQECGRPGGRAGRERTRKRGEEPGAPVVLRQFSIASCLRLVAHSHCASRANGLSEAAPSVLQQFDPHVLPAPVKQGKSRQIVANEMVERRRPDQAKSTDYGPQDIKRLRSIALERCRYSYLARISGIPSGDRPACSRTF